GPRFDASKATGNNVFNLPFTTSIPFLSTITDGLAKVAAREHVKLQNYPTQGQPNQWVEGMGQAVSQKASIINMLVTDVRVLRPQLASAKSAGIPVVSTQQFDPTQLNLVPANVTAVVPFNFSQAGRLMADWVIQDTGGKADVLVVQNSEVISTPPMLAALRSEFSKYCGASCKLTVVDVPAVDWAK